MSKTRQVTINSITPTPITIQGTPGCDRVRVVENLGVAGWPTTDLLIIKGDPSETAIRILAGKEYIEPTRGMFLKGVTPIWVQAVTGTTTLDIDEGSPL
jgi:hypothetical protein